jgi:hypothetical protein
MAQFGFRFAKNCDDFSLFRLNPIVSGGHTASSTAILILSG